MRLLMMITLWLFALPAVYAARPLQIVTALDGEYRYADYATETIVTGKQIKPYNLSLYHSLTVTDKEAMNALQRLMLSDMAYATNKEVALNNGKLNYGFFEFPPAEKDKKRFVFFFSNAQKAIVIYMEGNTSIEKIKSILKR